jgi:very-short-patch-repair endonuclease
MAPSDDWPRLSSLETIKALDGVVSLSTARVQIWMGAVSTRFDDFDNSSMHTSKNYVLSLFSLTRHIKSMPLINYGSSSRELNCEPFINNWLGRAVPHLQRFNGQDLVLTVYSLAFLDYQPSQEILKEFETHMMVIWNKFDARNIANILWGFAVLNHTLNPANKEMIKEECQTLNNLNMKDRHQLFLAEQVLGIKLPTKVDHSLFRNEPNNISIGERAFFELLSFDIEKSKYIKCIASTVDGFHKESNTVIYVDGPQHYDHNGHSRLSDLLLDRILKKYGFQILRVKLSDIKFEEKRKKFMKEVVRKLQEFSTLFRERKIKKKTEIEKNGAFSVKQVRSSEEELNDPLEMQSLSIEAVDSFSDSVDDRNSLADALSWRVEERGWAKRESEALSELVMLEIQELPCSSLLPHNRPPVKKSYRDVVYMSPQSK